ncbi:hypothetical protein Emag_005635 [Eimeria magna]
MAQESLEYRPQKLQLVDNMSPTVAAARWVLTSLPPGQSSLTGLADRRRQEQLGGPCGDGGPGGVFVGFWVSSVERLAALMGPGRASLLEFLNGVYRTGQALLGSTVAASAPTRRVAAPPAPHEPGAVARPAGPAALLRGPAPLT